MIGINCIANSIQFPAEESSGDDEYFKSNLYNISQRYCNNDAKAVSLYPAAIGISLKMN